MAEYSRNRQRNAPNSSPPSSLAQQGMLSFIWTRSQIPRPGHYREDQSTRGVIRKYANIFQRPGFRVAKPMKTHPGGASWGVEKFAPGSETVGYADVPPSPPPPPVVCGERCRPFKSMQMKEEV